jgi:hypothetical protein
MGKSSQIAWKILPLRRSFPLKVVPLIEVLLYPFFIDFPLIFHAFFHQLLMHSAILQDPGRPAVLP